MPVKTRLDPVVRLEENREERSLLALAEANRKVSDAERRLQDAHARAAADYRTRGMALEWEIADTAHARALHDLRAAQKAVTDAQVAAGESMNKYRAAHARAEALRRVAETRRQETIREIDRKEARELDDFQILRGPVRAA